MKIFKKVVGVVAIGTGVLFLVAGGTDIQLGFGCVLIAQGVSML